VAPDADNASEDSDAEDEASANADPEPPKRPRGLSGAEAGKRSAAVENALRVRRTAGPAADLMASHRAQEVSLVGLPYTITPWSFAGPSRHAPAPGRSVLVWVRRLVHHIAHQAKRAAPKPVVEPRT
jgi:hypothetical protein